MDLDVHGGVEQPGETLRADVAGEALAEAPALVVHDEGSLQHREDVLVAHLHVALFRLHRVCEHFDVWAEDRGAFLRVKSASCGGRLLLVLVETLRFAVKRGQLRAVLQQHVPWDLFLHDFDLLIAELAGDSYLIVRGLICRRTGVAIR